MDDFNDMGPYSWRSLQKNGGRRVGMSSSVARKRKFRSIVRTIFWILLLLCVGIGVGLGVRYLRENPRALHFGEPLPPLTTLEFSTNGVLTRDWAHGFIGFASRGDVEPDVRALKQKLLSTGQIRAASVERVWPDILRVSVMEEEPVARLLSAQPDGGRKVLLVSRRGGVYTGIGYAQETLNTLPFLDAVVLRRRTNGTYEPIPGMSVVADLLTEAALRLPNLRAQWTVVSLEDFDGDPNLPWALIRVHSKNLGEIIFAPRDFARQLDNLATAVSDFTSKNQKIKRIDLSMEGLGVAQFAEPPPKPPTRPSPSLEPVRRPSSADNPVQLLPAPRR